MTYIGLRTKVGPKVILYFPKDVYDRYGAGYIYREVWGLIREYTSDGQGFPYNWMYDAPNIIANQLVQYHAQEGARIATERPVKVDEWWDVERP